MIRTLIAAIAAVLLDCGAAFFVVGTSAPVPSPLGITSPLGMAPGSPVPPAGIPLGTTELASPGLSPVPAATIGNDGHDVLDYGESVTGNIRLEHDLRRRRNGNRNRDVAARQRSNIRSLRHQLHQQSSNIARVPRWSPSGRNSDGLRRDR